MALPIFTIANLDDLEAMIAVAEPREIDIASLPAVRDAPEFLAAVEEKVALGWTCPRMPQLVKANRFCFLLTKLADEDLPRLTDNPADVQALRDLRSRGDALYRLRNSASSLPPLVNLAGHFSNGLARSARQALKNRHAHQLSLARIHLIADRVEECLNSPIAFNLGGGGGANLGGGSGNGQEVPHAGINGGEEP